MEHKKDASRLIRNVSTVSICILISRITGFIRMVIMAWLFGTGIEQSAFIIAFRIPNLFRQLFGEGALSAAFIPQFTSILHKDGIEKAWKFAATIAQIMLVVLTFIVITVITGSILIANNYSLSIKAATVMKLLPITFPYMWFICLAALTMAILNSFDKFFIPAISSVILNVIWIIALAICWIFKFSPQNGIFWVSYSIIVGGIAQLGIQLPSLFRLGFRLSPGLGIDSNEVKDVLKRMFPSVIALGAGQVNVLIDSLLALLIAEWAPAALSFAELCVYFPLGIFATAFGTVLLPHYSHSTATSNYNEIRYNFNNGIKLSLFLLVPSALGFIFMGYPVISTIFELKAFTKSSTEYTVRAMIGYATGLPFFGMYKIIAPLFYAMKDMKTPIRCAIWCICLNFILNIIFIFIFPEGYKHAGLAYATSITSAINCFILSFILHHRICSLGWKNILKSVTKTSTTSIIAMTSSYLVWVQAQSFSHSRISQSILLGISITIAIITFIFTNLLTRSPELQNIIKVIKKLKV